MKYWTSMVLAALGLALMIVGLSTMTAHATPPHDGVCTALDSGKIDVVGEYPTVTVVAPDGFLIDGYCVKAGSIQQGLGPEYVELATPVAELVFGHSSGKDVSHYSLSYTPVGEPTPTPEPTVPPNTTVPPKVTPEPPHLAETGVRESGTFIGAGLALLLTALGAYLVVGYGRTKV